jgi:hypothetical protein
MSRDCTNERNLCEYGQIIAGLEENCPIVVGKAFRLKVSKLDFLVASAISSTQRHALVIKDNVMCTEPQMEQVRGRDVSNVFN